MAERLVVEGLGAVAEEFESELGRMPTCLELLVLLGEGMRSLHDGSQTWIWTG